MKHKGYVYHRAATRLVQSGMNQQLAGRLLGHSQPQTTYRYLSADIETARQAARMLEALQTQAVEMQTTTTESIH